MMSGKTEIFGLVKSYLIEFCVIKIVAFFMQDSTVFALEKTRKTTESFH